MASSYGYWYPDLIVSTINLHAPTLKQCLNCCKDVDCNFVGADTQIWLCDCKHCVNCNKIYTDCTCPPNFLATRKLLGIGADGQEILESDDDFRQRVKAMYESSK